MKLQEARAKLKGLANGKYRSLNYNLVDSAFGEIIIECSVYVDGYSHHSAETWEAALNSLEISMYPERKPVPEVEDI